MPDQKNLFMEMNPEEEELLPEGPFASHNVIPIEGTRLALDELRTYRPQYLHLSDGTLYELKGVLPRQKVVRAKAPVAPAPNESAAAAAASAAPAAGETAEAPVMPKASGPKPPPGAPFNKVLELIGMKPDDPFVKLVKANREHPDDFSIRTQLQKSAGDFYLKAAMAFRKQRAPELRALIRFRAILDEAFLTPDEIASFTKLVNHKEASENIFYADEWLEKLYDGEAGFTFDEVKRTEIFRKTKKPVNSIKVYDAGMIDLLGEDEAYKFELENVFLQWPFLCIGRRGNHFPFLETGMVPGAPEQAMAKKRDVNKLMTEMEKLDHKLFMREVLGQLPDGREGFIDLHQQPYVILAGCVAQGSICWDAWHRCDKRKSRGRVAMPVFAEKNFEEVVQRAMGDYRWTLAKDAALDWASEGITGFYFKYWTEEKKKPAEESAIDKSKQLKDNFIDDYMTWLRWEAKGIQKINKELRPIFWRYMPFSPAKRDELAKVAPVYADLAAKSSTWERQDAAEKKKKR